MPSITFNLETVTPLFLAGADQTTAELRPPAFRGALRYWLRAIAGAYYWNNPAQLREVESALLGNTQGSSNIILRLKNIPEQLQLLPVRLKQDEHPGLSYLLFSMKGSGGKNPRPQRQAIGVKNPVKFSLTLSTRPDPTNFQKQRKNLLIAANCFWLAVNLGGFGSRERRGVGSLRVTKVDTQDVDQEELPSFLINCKPALISRYFQSELIKAKKNCYQLLGLDIGNLPVIDQTPQLEIYSKYTSKVFLIKEPYHDWQEALETIGEKYKNYRQELEPQKRIVFGLPLTNYNTNSRRPSPLRIKVIKVHGSYYCLLIQIKATFPENSNIKNFKNPSHKVINDFISSFDEEEIQQVG